MKPFTPTRIAKTFIALTINSFLASIAYLLFFCLPVLFIRPDGVDVALKGVLAIWPIAFVYGLYVVIKKRKDDRGFEQKVKEGKVPPKTLDFIRRMEKMNDEGKTKYDRWLG